MVDLDAMLPMLLGRISPYTLVLLRIGGMFATAPLFGAKVIPARVRAFVALALAVAIAPAQASAEVASNQPAEYLLAAGAEVLVGVALGVGLRSLFVALQLAGGVVSLASGLNLADVYNPESGDQVPLLAGFFELVGVTSFVAIGGHRLLVSGLLDTFAAMPPGRVAFDQSIGELFSVLAGQSLSLALAIAAPALAALLLAALVVGFGLNTAVTFGVLIVMLGALAWAVDDRVEPLMASLLDRLLAAR